MTKIVSVLVLKKYYSHHCRTLEYSVLNATNIKVMIVNSD